MLEKLEDIALLLRVKITNLAPSHLTVAMGVNLSETSGDNAEQYAFSGGSGKLVAFEILAVLLQLLSIVFNGAIIYTLSRRSLLKYPSNR